MSSEPAALQPLVLVHQQPLGEEMESLSEQDLSSSSFGGRALALPGVNR